MYTTIKRYCCTTPDITALPASHQNQRSNFGYSHIQIKLALSRKIRKNAIARSTCSYSSHKLVAANHPFCLFQYLPFSHITFW